MTALFALAIMPFIAHAQFMLPGFSGAARIAMDPSYPRPGDTVKLSLESSLIDLDTSSLSWRIDGKPVPSTDKTITTIAGPLGSVTNIDAQITTREGSVISTSASIVPTRIDILYDGNSYVPPFYEGRALPAAGGTFKLEAVPYFKKQSGASVPVSDIIFTWKRNGEVIGSVSGRGKASVIISSPYLFGHDTITVNAESVDGSFTGETSIIVSSAEPVVRLYEDHPLYGLRLDQAIATTSSIIGHEVTLSAIPFFSTARTPTDDALTYDWRVNGMSISTGDDTKNSLTLGAPAGGQANLSVSLSHATNIFFSADAAWTILFSDTAVRKNPFSQPN